MYQIRGDRKYIKDYSAKYTPEKYPLKSVSKPIKQGLLTSEGNQLFRKALITHNLNYLNNMKDFEKELVIEYLKSNDRFSNLLERGYQETYYYLNGPKTFTTLQSDLYSKIIHIIGERHDTIEDCRQVMGIPDSSYVYENETLTIYNQFFKEAYEIRKSGRGGIWEYHLGDKAIIDSINSAPAYTDIFLEVDYPYYVSSGGKFYHKTSRAEMIAKGIDRSMSRVHYVDVRGTVAMKNYSKDLSPEVYFPIAIEVMIGTHNDLNMRRENAILFREYYNKYFNENLTYEKWKDGLIEMIFSNKRLVKEVDRSYMGKDILSYYKNYVVNEHMDIDDYHHIRSLHNGIMEYLRELLDTGRVLKGEEYGDFKEEEGGDFTPTNMMLKYLIDITSYVLDVYSLARIFRRFNNVSYNQPIEPRNIIVYVGDFHAQSIRDFLKQRVFTEYEGRMMGENCTYTGLDKPLFTP